MELSITYHKKESKPFGDMRKQLFHNRAMKSWIALREARKNAGLSQEAVGQLFDPPISRAAVAQWETEDGTTPDSGRLGILSKAYKMTVGQLLGYEHRAEIPRGKYNVVPVAESSVKLPLVSWVSAGHNGDANDPYGPGAAGEWIDFDGPFGKQAFCLTVRGSSMVAPDGSGFPDGCIIAVDPALKPKSGDFVVVRFNDTDEATFKQYIIDGPVKLLKPLNATYPTFQVTPDAQMCGVVVEVSMRRNLRNGRKS